MARVLNLAVLLSGSGRTLENLQQAILAGRSECTCGYRREQ